MDSSRTRATSRIGVLPALVVALLGALALLVGPVTAASAHASLVDSDPEANATLVQAPSTVTLVFDETPSDFAAAVAITGPDGTTVQGTGARVSGRELTVDVAPVTAPGRYRLAYRVVSADGHPVSGEFGFSFAPRVVPRPTSSPATSSATAASPTAASPTAASPTAASPTATSPVPGTSVSGSGSGSGSAEVPSTATASSTAVTSTASNTPSSTAGSSTAGSSTAGSSTAGTSAGSSAAAPGTEVSTAASSTAPSSATGAEPGPPRPAGSGSGSVWLLVVVAAVLLLGAAGAFLLARRHRRRTG